jgi:hypothetical protein
MAMGLKMRTDYVYPDYSEYPDPSHRAMYLAKISDALQNISDQNYSRCRLRQR